MDGDVYKTEGKYKFGETNKDREYLTCVQLIEKLAPSPMGRHGIDTRTYSLESLAHLQGLGNGYSILLTQLHCFWHSSAFP